MRLNDRYNGTESPIEKDEQIDRLLLKSFRISKSKCMSADKQILLFIQAVSMKSQRVVLSGTISNTLVVKLTETCVYDILLLVL